MILETVLVPGLDLWYLDGVFGGHRFVTVS